MSNIKSEQAKLIEALEELLRLPENKDCVDCGTKAPRWASTNLGVFMCLRCSGIHRSLGVHVSKVKSVSLDKWTPAQVDVMREWGNKRANDYYEATLPSDFNRSIELSSNSQLERFIRDKYERKMFIGRGSKPNTGGAPRPQRAQERPRAEPSAPAPQVSKPNGTSHHVPVPSIQAPKKPAQEPEPDLMKWEDPRPAPTQQQQAPNGNDFGFFISANDGPSIALGEEVKNSLLDDPNFINSGNPPKADKSSILSLYSQPPMSAVPVAVAPSPYGPNTMNPAMSRYPVYNMAPTPGVVPNMRPPVYGMPNPGYMGGPGPMPNMMMPPAGGYNPYYPGVPNNLGMGNHMYGIPNNNAYGGGGFSGSQAPVSIPPSHPTPAPVSKAPAIQVVGTASSSFQQSMSASGFKL
eukprot:TRINITY_DN7331_c1_g1_i1.p1 TRINITY_DN7331_c1_g1~~TRINITY_DN7331_c1_g1_i1.p1  ORF type:complete len:407 (+),score=99.46 TRINITY_DN7331_c1_g1_i1:1473-2693(+)